jgi:H+/Na+-translocating ferredoxin:NAD+ oxidoreductase subunit C
MSTTTKPLTFRRGGVHPHDDGKASTRDLPLVTSEPPELVTILLAQHIGAPAKAVVKARDAVLKGQIIGEAQGFISANVHASVSGVVKTVGTCPSPVSGQPVPAVTIANDGEEAWADGLNTPQDVGDLDAKAMVALVHECGVVGMGGATFPTHVKLAPPSDQPIEYVLVNAAECEPFVTVDYRLMVERPDDLVEALKIVMNIVSAPRGVVGIEANKPEAISAMQQAAAGESRIDIVALATRYPQGAEQQLITAVTGREVPSGGLPSKVGTLVHNVATLLAVRDAVLMRRPLIERGVTVTGDAVENPGNFIERIGANAGDILRRQGIRPEANQLIGGGPMMGIAQGTLDTPIIKGSSCLILRHTEPIPPMRSCIRCGRCVAQCPLGLVPSEISVACENHDWDAAARVALHECKECGCCAYACPARRPIVQQVKFAKSELRRQKK